MRRTVCMVVYNDLRHDARVFKEATTLRRAGYDVRVIGMRDANTPPLTGWDDIAVERIDVGTTRSLRARYARFWWQAVRLLVARTPDIIHSHDLDTLAPCWLVAVLASRPLVHDAHEFWTELPSLVGRPAVSGVWKMMARVFIPRCDAVITVSDGIADAMAARYGMRPYVVRNLPPKRGPAAPVALRERCGFPDGAPVLIFQGGLLPGLGIERAIAVMDLLPEARLVIIGDGPLRDEVRRQKDASPSSDRIALLPPVPFAELPRYTVAADVGLHLGESSGLNVRYGLPNKLFEYIAAGLPVVMVDWPAQGEIVRRYDVGTLVPPDSAIETVAQAIRETLARREECAANARRAAEELTWERESARLLDCYEQLSRIPD